MLPAAGGKTLEIAQIFRFAPRCSALRSQTALRGKVPHPIPQNQKIIVIIQEQEHESEIFCLICTWLAAAGTLLQASELRADLTGSLQNTGNIKLSAVGNKAFYNNSGFIISNTSRLELKTAPVLNSNAGTIRLKLRSLDWSGNDSSSKYFFYARKRGGKDVIFLRKDANGDLVFAMGKLPHDLDTAGVSAAFWKKNAVHTLEAVWDNDVIELYVDNIKVASRQRTVKSLAWSDPMWIGGSIWGTSGGKSALDYFQLSDKADF